MLHDALAAHRGVANKQGELVTLIFLADEWGQQRCYDNAVECAEGAVSIATAIGDKHGEGLALHHISRICLADNRTTDALAHLRQAAFACHAAGDNRGEAEILRLLAVTLDQAGHSAEARVQAQRALDILDIHGDPNGSARAVLAHLVAPPEHQ